MSHLKEFKVQKEAWSNIDEGQVIWSQWCLPLGHGGTSDYYNMVVFHTCRLGMSCNGGVTLKWHRSSFINIVKWPLYALPMSPKYNYFTFTWPKAKHQLILRCQSYQTTVKWEYCAQSDKNCGNRTSKLSTSWSTLRLLVILRLFLAEGRCHRTLKVIRCLTFYWKLGIKGAQ